MFTKMKDFFSPHNRLARISFAHKENDRFPIVLFEKP